MSQTIKAVQVENKIKVLNDIKALRIIRKNLVYGKMKTNIKRNNVSLEGLTPEQSKKFYILEDITTLTPQSIIDSDKYAYNFALSTTIKNIIVNIFTKQIYDKWMGYQLDNQNINDLYIKEGNFWYGKDDDMLYHTPEDVEKYL